MFGAKWLRSRVSGLGLIVIGLAAFGVPAAHAVTVHPHHTETAEPHDGAPWQPGFGGGGLTHFHVSFNSFESSTAISNGNIFRSESFFSNGQGSERVWSFSGQHVLSYERLRTFLRDGDCEDGSNPPPHVSNVPIPSAVWLLLSAIALLFGISFCRKTVKS
jgi:hypothetical protein